jgi:hypothetical protein
MENSHAKELGARILIIRSTIYLSPHFLTLHFAGIAGELGSEVLSRG